MLALVEEFEETKFKDLHQRILEDEGIPYLTEEMRKLKFEIEYLYDKEYTGIKGLDIRQGVVDRFQDKMKAKKKQKRRES